VMRSRGKAQVWVGWFFFACLWLLLGRCRFVGLPVQPVWEVWVLWSGRSW